MGEAKRRLDLTGRTMNKLQPGQQVNVDLKDATQRKCECGCEFFTPAMTVWTVSAIMSPSGDELTAQKPALLCVECHKQLK